MSETQQLSADTAIYQRLQKLSNTADSHAAIECLIEHLRETGQYHELFEALKMRLRSSLGLPAAQAGEETKLDEERETQLEKGLLEACVEVGRAFFRAGKVREGWMYMRPLGDRGLAAEAISVVQPDDENTDELIEVLLHEAVDVKRGYALALERLGTCNSITLFEQTLAQRPRADQQVAAALLVRHVHSELLANLKRDIAKREGTSSEDQAAEPDTSHLPDSVEELLAERPELLRDGSYHLDTSHVASTVRFARVLEDEESLKFALDITAYGMRLHPQYQYPGEEPFLDLYPASAAFFRALLGQQVDAGIRYFQRKADSVDQQQYGLIAVEVLIDLLSRTGKNEQALKEYAKRIPVGSRTLGIAPSLLQLSERLGHYELMQKICSERNDLLGFAAATLAAKTSS